MKTTLIAGILIGTLPALAAFDGPCKDKRRALRESMNALKNCNRAWQESIRLDAADPADDCTALQAQVIDHAKAIKACRKEAKAAGKK